MLLNYDALQQLLVKTYVTLDSNFQLIRGVNLKSKFTCKCFLEYYIH